MMCLSRFPGRGAAVILAAAMLPAGCGGPRVDEARPPGPEGPAATRPAEALAPDVRAVIDLANAARTRHGLAPLVPDPRLMRAAQAHARDLERSGLRQHAGSDGSSPGDRASRAGYEWSRVAENIAWSDRTPMTPDQVVRGWLDSPGHRANLLHARMRHTGVARAGLVWVQVFAAP